MTMWVCDRRVLSSGGNHRRFPAAHGSAKHHRTFLTSQPSAPSALGTITTAQHVLLLACPLPRSEVSLRSTMTTLGGPDPHPSMSSSCPPSYPGNCHFQLCYSSALEPLKCSPKSAVTFHGYQFLVKFSSLVFSLAMTGHNRPLALGTPAVLPAGLRSHFSFLLCLVICD